MWRFVELHLYSTYHKETLSILLVLLSKAIFSVTPYKFQHFQMTWLDIMKTAVQGFYARSVHSEENEGFYTEDELAAISKRSAICFTLGMRFFYALIPLVSLFFLRKPSYLENCLIDISIY